MAAQSRAAERQAQAALAHESPQLAAPIQPAVIIAAAQSAALAAFQQQVFWQRAQLLWQHQLAVRAALLVQPTTLV